MFNLRISILTSWSTFDTGMSDSWLNVTFDRMFHTRWTQLSISSLIIAFLSSSNFQCTADSVWPRFYSKVSIFFQSCFISQMRVHILTWLVALVDALQLFFMTCFFEFIFPLVNTRMGGNCQEHLFDHI